MKIEVGKRYINAEGDVVKIAREYPLTFYMYACREYTYSVRGRRIIGQESPQDLICEVVPELHQDLINSIITQKEFIERHIKHWIEYE